MARGMIRDGRQTAFDKVTRGLDKHFEDQREGRLEDRPLETLSLADQIALSKKREQEIKAAKVKAAAEAEEEPERFIQDCPHFNRTPQKRK